MSDEINDLIAEARAFVQSWDVRGPWAPDSPIGMVHRLADALEAELAARQPSGDDREALARRLREGDDPVNTWEQATEAQREFWRNEADRALGSRAVVPDAATRVPVQGEPKDDREALARVLYIARDDFALPDRMARAWDAPGPHGRQRWYRYADAVLAAGFSRASVPDAATDVREHLHAKCNCVPDLGPAHCHLCGDAKGEPVPWAECEAETSADSATEKVQAELDEMAGRFAEFLCEVTGSMLSYTHYSVATMTQYTEEYFERHFKEHHDDYCEKAEALEAERDAALARIAELEAELEVAMRPHSECERSGAEAGERIVDLEGDLARAEARIAEAALAEVIRAVPRVAEVIESRVVSRDPTPEEIARAVAAWLKDGAR